jgi:hypothetical protein
MILADVSFEMGYDLSYIDDGKIKIQVNDESKGLKGL